MTRLIYLDNSATTPIQPEVLKTMEGVLAGTFGNPSSSHGLGVAAERVVREARDRVAAALGAAPEEIVFTSGGTEANNLALKGLTAALRRKGNHLITTAVEHPSVLKTCRQLEEEGFDVTYLPVDPAGIIDSGQVAAALRDDTILVSIMHVNNEVGAVQPVEEVGRLLRRLDRKVYFHVDAVQSFGWLGPRPRAWNVDLMTVSAHKIHGPKGAGALFVGSGTRLKPLITGGDQEGALRPGTENVAGIAGFGAAALLISQAPADRAERVRELRLRLWEGIAAAVPEVRCNGPDGQSAAPHILNVSFPVRAEVLLHSLEEAGIYVSGGAACHSRRPEPSHVLKAMGVRGQDLNGAIRFSLSSLTTAEDIDYTIGKLADTVPELLRYQGRRR